jgi:cysteine synthase B
MIECNLLEWMMTDNIITTKPLTSTVFKSHTILDLVGNTPLLLLNHIAPDLPERVGIYGKPEWFNPSGSSKDRPASQIIRSALATGDLGIGKILLDSTSGNMGIAYATFGRALGIPVHLAIPSNASPRRLKILRALGVEITLTDPSDGSDGARIVAEGMFHKNPDRFFFANQYQNPENWRAHYYTTGPEIVSQTGGRVTHFIAGLGTSGTLMGTGRYLQEHIPGIRLVAIQPDSPLHGIEGLKHMESSPNPEIFDPEIPDEIVVVSTEDAHSTARQLAYEQGLLVGTSAAAAVYAAIQVAHKVEEGILVVLLPDSAEKYLDLPYWNHV